MDKGARSPEVILRDCRRRKAKVSCQAAPANGRPVGFTGSSGGFTGGRRPLAAHQALFFGGFRSLQAAGATACFPSLGRVKASRAAVMSAIGGGLNRSTRNTLS